MVNDAAEIDDEIDEDVRRLHAEAEKQIAKLKEKEEQLPIEKIVEQKEIPVSATVKPFVARPAIRTFDQWFYGEGMSKELQAISKRRGNLVGLMTAYSNLDILRSLKEIADSLKEIPDLIQDVVDSVDALGKKIDELTKVQKEEIPDKSVVPGRKRGGQMDKEK